MDDQQQRLRRTLHGRLAGKGDQALREFREVYDSLDAAQKQQFVEAVVKVADGNEILAKLPAQLHAAIETYWVARDEGGDGHAELAPKVLWKAINAWQRGQGYSPGGLGFAY